MKKVNFQPSILQVIYLLFYLILFASVVYIPTLINNPLHISEKLIVEEETLEGSLIGILFILSIVILNLYKRDVIRHKELIKQINIDKMTVEERLKASDHYIGIINVQIQEIKSIFTNINKYPETKEDLKRTFRFFGERVLGIVSADWALFRIIDSTNQRTLSEHFETRKGFPFGYPHVSNRMVLEKMAILPYTAVTSGMQNLNIQVACIVPVDSISNDQVVFIQAIINEITKLFIILNSSYYKKENKLFLKSKTEIPVYEQPVRLTSSRGIKVLPKENK
jgi:hypothetical protein